MKGMSRPELVGKIVQIVCPRLKKNKRSQNLTKQQLKEIYCKLIVDGEKNESGVGQQKPYGI